MNQEQIEAIYPLSPMQQGILFHALYAPAASTYFEQMSCRIDGSLQAAAFRRAWQAVLDHHPVLRSSFIWEEIEEPLQIVQKGVELPWQEEDWRGLNDEQQAARLDTWLQQDRRRGFDFARAPLLRMALLRIGEQAYYFVRSWHHILFDGWCNQLLIGEAMRAYEAYSQGGEPEVEEVRPYRDYIVWLRQQDKQEAERFWRQELKGMSSPTALGGKVEGRGEAVRQSRQMSKGVGRGLTQRLQELARGENVTLSTVLQAGWAKVLSGMSGEREVVYGMTVSGRGIDLAGVERMVGLCINTVAVRVEVRGGERVREYVRRMKEREERRREYESSGLVEVAGWSEIGRGKALFESLFLFQNYPVESAIVERTGTLPRISEARTFERVDYPLMMVAGPGEELRLRLVYDGERFESSAMQGLLEQMGVVLEGMVVAENPWVGNLAQLSRGQRQQLLVEWNDSEQAFAEPASLPELFQQQARRTPDAIAVSSAEGQLSYGGLNGRANQMAHYLMGLGVQAEVRVGLLLGRSPAMVEAVLAVLKAGAAYVPLERRYPPQRLAYMLEDAISAADNPYGLVISDAPGPWQQVRVLNLGAEAEAAQIRQMPTTNPAVGVSGEQLAYVIYTSGSTGRPKAVAVTHRGLRNLALAQSPLFAIRPGVAVLQFSSLCFDASASEIATALSAGARLVLPPQQEMMVGDQLSEVLCREQIEVATLPPSVLASLPEVLTCHPRTLVVAGEAVGEEMVRRWAPGRRMLDAYGPTEASVCATVSGDLSREAEVRIGRGIGNVKVYVAGGVGEEAGIGARGEIYIGGEGVARGYLGKAEETAERFVPDWVSGLMGERLYRTGDEGRWDAGGEVEYLGRKDGQVKVRGYRIELGEIEEQLLEEAGIRQAAVVVQGSGAEQRLIGYVVKEEGARQSEAELRRRLSERLPEYMVPVRVVEMEEMPLTGNGKLDRRGLPEPGVETSCEAVAGEQTAIEELVSGIFAEVLKQGQVGVVENFFELGGHSLVVIQVTSRIREALGVDIPLRVVFERPTVAALAETVEKELGAVARFQAPSMQRVSRDVKLPLSYAQQRLWFIQQLESDGAVYNIPLAVRLRGTLDLSLLAQSLNEIVRRHEVLRTRFETQDGLPSQIIEEASETALLILDFSGLDEEVRESLFRDSARREFGRSFDLARGPVWRATVVRLSLDTHILVLTMHHVASDAWSTGLLIEEFAVLYDAFREGRTSPLEELPMQYADFAVWQRNWLTGEVLDDQIDYWRRQLAGVRALMLPTDYPRRPVANHRGARISFDLSPELSTALKTLSRQQGATLFMTLLAAFKTLLYHYTRQDDIAVGTNVANRQRVEVERMIGFFVNMLILRTDCSGNPTFEGLLQRVRETALNAYKYQDVPFEKLVEVLQSERQPGQSPFFQIVFSLQSAARRMTGLALSGEALPMTAGGSHDLILNWEGVVNETAKYDLIINMRETERHLSATFEYDSDLFKAASMQQLADDFTRLLKSIADRPETRLDDLDVLSAEQERLFDRPTHIDDQNESFIF